MKSHFGGTILGQGTHGTIIIDPLDSSKVIKSFTILSNCEKLQDEYEVQNEIILILLFQNLVLIQLQERIANILCQEYIHFQNIIIIYY